MPNRNAHPPWPIDLYIDCVLLSSFLSEFTFLRNVFRTSGVRMHHAESLDEADFLLTATGSSVLLCDVIFEGGYWQGALGHLGGGHPMVTMLVIADPVDQPFLEDLFPRGACGVIWRPFQFQKIARQIRAVHEASMERRAVQEEALAAKRPIKSG